MAAVQTPFVALRWLLIAVALVAVWLAWLVWIPLGEGAPVTVTVPSGASFERVLDRLDSAGVLRNRFLFRLYAGTRGVAGTVRPGTYRLVRSMSFSNLADALGDGRGAGLARLTIPEGSTVRRIAGIAARTVGCDSAELVRLAGDRAFLRSLGIDATSAEGWLMPDTYFVPKGEEPRAILERLAAAMRSYYTPAMQARAAGLGLTPYQALTLASIVEGEARVDKERPVIARVYLNRLKRGMLLQADPTLQYILPDGPRRLLSRDLQSPSPYNSYRVPGLPPTPINNPGRSSIQAVLAPDSNDYLYFVARADGSGGHTFSRTMEEHNRAVADYRKRMGY